MKMFLQSCEFVYIYINTYVSMMFFLEKMSKQLTLFWKRALPEPYFKDPKTIYERDVNRKWLESHERF